MIRNPVFVGGDTEDERAFDLQIITWNEPYPIRKRADRRRKHKQTVTSTCHGALDLDLDTIKIHDSDCIRHIDTYTEYNSSEMYFLLPLPKTGTLPLL